MRRLPLRPTKQQKLVVDAVCDFYNVDDPRRNEIDMALWIMGRKRGVKLTDEQMYDITAIQANVGDETYRQSLLQNPVNLKNYPSSRPSKNILHPEMVKYQFKRKVA